MSYIYYFLHEVIRWVLLDLTKSKIPTEQDICNRWVEAIKNPQFDPKFTISQTFKTTTEDEKSLWPCRWCVNTESNLVGFVGTIGDKYLARAVCMQLLVLDKTKAPFKAEMLRLCSASPSVSNVHGGALLFRLCAGSGCSHRAESTCVKRVNRHWWTGVWRFDSALHNMFYTMHSHFAWTRHASDSEQKGLKIQLWELVKTCLKIEWMSTACQLPNFRMRVYHDRGSTEQKSDLHLDINNNS